MRKLLALAAAAATFALPACSGHTMNAVPYAGGGASPQLAQSVTPQSLDVPAGTTATAPGFADGLAYAESTTQAHGSKTQIISAPQGEAQLGCGTQTTTATASPPALSSPYVTGKNVVDTYDSTVGGGKGTVTATATIQDVSVLKGLITASTVKAVSSSTASSASQSSTTTGSEFTDLVVQGKKLGDTQKPNTTVTLNGYGYVVLNEVENPVSHVRDRASSNQTSALVNMMYVVVNIAGNPLKVPPGTTIVVGSASTAYTVPPAPYSVNPNAYSFYATGYDGSATNVSGPWAVASVACNATEDQKLEPATKTALGSIGTMNDKTTTSATASTTTADAYSTTASASLLNGLIVGKNVQGSVTLTRTGTSFKNVGTVKFTSLSINGTAVPASVKPNTKMLVKNLGYVVVNEQYVVKQNGGASEQLNVADLYVTDKNNTYKLVVGAHVVLGHASSQISHI